MVNTYKPIEKPLTKWDKIGPIIYLISGIIYIVSVLFDSENKIKAWNILVVLLPLQSAYDFYKKYKNRGTYFLEIGDSQMRWKLPEMPEIEWRDFTEFKRIVLKPKEIVFFRDSSFMDFIPLPQFAEPDQAAIKEEISTKAKEYNIELIIR